MVASLLKAACRTSFRFFFRKWQIHFAAPLPNAPIIFLANHPNTFLDGILVASSVRQNPWFLARGGAFRKKWATFLLSQLRMLPIYRFRDGYGTLRKNEDIIHRCADLLSKGNSLLLFPEGDNSLHFNLEPLQKGFIKIAEATYKANPNLPLHIVPVGIQFSLETKGLGGTALVQFGEPIVYKELANQPTEKIQKQVWEKMNSLILHIDEADYDKKLAYLLQHRSLKSNLKKQLAEDQQIIDNYPHLLPNAATPKKPSLLYQINKVYFKINHFLLKQLVEWIASLIKEEHMKNAIRFTVGMFLSLPVYLLQSWAVLWVTRSLPIACAYAITLPLSLWIHIKK